MTNSNQSVAQRPVQQPSTAVVAYETAHGVVELSTAIVRTQLCADATELEALLFLKLCQAQKLNPFIGDAYLVKYKTQAGPKTAMIVGKSAFMRRAEENPNYDGFEAGLIVRAKEEGSVGFDIEGAVVPENCDLVGGWSKVYRKDRRIPTVSRVSLREYHKGQSLWNSSPATMIRKVALVQSLREAFPTMYSGLRDAIEEEDQVVRHVYGDVVEDDRPTHDPEPETFEHASQEQPQATVAEARARMIRRALDELGYESEDAVLGYLGEDAELTTFRGLGRAWDELKAGRRPSAALPE